MGCYYDVGSTPGPGTFTHTNAAKKKEREREREKKEKERKESKPFILAVFLCCLYLPTLTGSQLAKKKEFIES